MYSINPYGLSTVYSKDASLVAGSKFRQILRRHSGEIPLPPLRGRRLGGGPVQIVFLGNSYCHAVGFGFSNLEFQQPLSLRQDTAT
jgi:hypothetical protein